MNLLKIFAALSFVAIVIFNCGKEDKKPFSGEASVFKNGLQWTAGCRADISSVFDAKVDVSMGTFDDDGFFIENLIIFKIPLEKGRYPLKYTVNQPPDDGFVGALYATLDGDQLLDAFKIYSNDSTSYVEITAYDKQSGNLEGDFKMILWPDFAGPNSPDSIVFSGGNFRVRLDR
jgi:hypothetical protein